MILTKVLVVQDFQANAQNVHVYLHPVKMKRGSYGGRTMIALRKSMVAVAGDQVVGSVSCSGHVSHHDGLKF